MMACFVAAFTPSVCTSTADRDSRLFGKVPYSVVMAQTNLQIGCAA
jgi:hypothetical protein